MLRCVLERFCIWCWLHGQTTGCGQLLWCSTSILFL